MSIANDLIEEKKIHLNNYGAKVIEVIGANLHSNAKLNANPYLLQEKNMTIQNTNLSNDLRKNDNINRIYHIKDNYDINKDMDFQKYSEDLKMNIDTRKKLNNHIKIYSCKKRVHKLKLIPRKSLKGNRNLTIIQ